MAGEVKEIHKTEDARSLTKGVANRLIGMANQKFDGQTVVGGASNTLSIVIPAKESGRHWDIYFYDFCRHLSPVASITNDGTVVNFHAFEKNGQTAIHLDQIQLCEAMRVLYQTLDS